MWYRQGTISVTNGSRNVQGVGTYFTTHSKVGDIFTVDEQRLYEIQSITDDLNLVLVEAYAGATASTITYAIIPNFTNTTNADLASRISKLIQSYQTNTDQMVSWLGGIAGGGANGDGKYPITNFYGNTSYVKSPAQLQADYTAIQSNVAITGGTIDGTVIGGTTPAAITGTTITSTVSSASGVLPIASIANDPRIAWKKTNASADQGLWDIDAGVDGNIYFRALNDADSAANTFLQVSRSGYLINSVLFPQGRILINGAADNGVDTVQVAGSGKFTGGLIVNGQIQLGDAFAMKGNNTVSGWSGIDLSNGSRFIFGIENSVTTASTRRPVISVQDTTNWTYFFELYSDGYLTSQGPLATNSTISAARALLGGATDDGVSALQVLGDSFMHGDLTLQRLGGSKWYFQVPNTDMRIVSDASNGASSLILLPYSGRVLIGQGASGTPVDNGVDLLQVAGRVYVKSSGQYSRIMMESDVSGDTGLQVKDSVAHYKIGINVGGVGSGAWNIWDFTRGLSPFAISPAGRMLVSPNSTPVDNGIEALQVNGSIRGSQITFSGNGFTILGNGSNIISTNAHFTPYNDAGSELGQSNLRWNAAWIANGTINTSDRRQKKAITDTDLGIDFINALRPVSYRWKDPEADNGVHYGLIAQEVDELLARMGVQSFAGMSKPEDGYMGLNYSEFIAPLIKAVQELSQRVAQFEAQTLTY